MKLTEKKNIATFTIDRDMIQEDPALVREVLKDVIVVECQYNNLDDCYEYTGIHPDFPLCEQGVVPLMIYPKCEIHLHGRWRHSAFLGWKASII